MWILVGHAFGPHLVIVSHTRTKLVDTDFTNIDIYHLKSNNEDHQFIVDNRKGTDHEHQHLFYDDI